MADIRVLAAVLTEEQLTLYKEDGTNVVILQPDNRIRPIIEKITPDIMAGRVAIIQDDEFNSYGDFEKKTKGGIKFFRVLKNAVKHLFGTDDDRVEPQVLGQVPGKAGGATPPAAQIPTPTVQAQAEQVMARTEAPAQKAEPRKVPVLGEGLLTNARSMSQDDSTLQPDETVVAVVGNTIVPGVEALKPQFDHVSRNSNPIGLENLLKRLAVMIDKRGHSVEDILRFLERGDLPIADDGSIIAYKRLKTNPGRNSQYAAAPGLFFDCHSGNIPQRVGSYVMVDEKLVDKDRRNECSNGLHIGRRSYMGSFSGDVMVLCKIEPEDIITVPHNDPNKVRVCGYHILAQLTNEQFRIICSDKPMTTDNEAQRLLGQAISGQHVERLEEVRVTEQYGGGVQIKALVGNHQVLLSKAAAAAKSAPKASALDDLENATRTDPKSVAKETQAARAAQPAPAAPVTPASPSAQPKAPASGSTRVATATGFYATMKDQHRPIGDRKVAASQLADLKKKAKVGWTVLGLTDSVAEEIKVLQGLTLPTQVEPKAKAQPVVKEKPKASTPTKPVQAKPTPKTTTKIKPTPVPSASPAPSESGLTADQKEALRLLREGKQSKSEIARRCQTSPRSLDRLLAKYGK